MVNCWGAPVYRNVVDVGVTSTVAGFSQTHWAKSPAPHTPVSRTTRVTGEYTASCTPEKVVEQLGLQDVWYGAVTPVAASCSQIPSLDVAREARNAFSVWL
jgi:hypothetical protein